MAIGNHRETSAEVGYYALILFSIFVAVYFAYFGFVLAQIWFYNGELEPKPKKFLILSPHIKEQLRRKEGVFTNNDSTSSDAEGTHNTSSRIRHTEILDLNKEEDECSNDEERNALKEEKRISRMSAFLQDDCGDGSQFPYVPEIDPKKYDSVKNLTPYTLPRFRSKPPSYMQMGLKKLDAENWLKIDHTYKEFHAARAELLMRHHDEVIQIVEEGEIACVELMRDVVSFITRRYPNIFEVFERFSIGKAVRNKKTGEEFSMQKPWDVHPLEMCARLTMEDFNILKKSDFSGEHYLVASATLFPAGWRLRERIGQSVADLHGPVPFWKELPDFLSYFSRLSSNPRACMERHSFFVQIKPDNRPLHQLLYIQEGKDFFPGSICNLYPENIIIRRERQTFRRLPESKTIVFTVKTSVERLIDIPELEKPNLVAEIRAWPDEIATYKGRDLWQRTLIGFCENKPVLGHASDVDLDSDDIGSMTRV